MKTKEDSLVQEKLAEVNVPPLLMMYYMYLFFPLPPSLPIPPSLSLPFPPSPSGSEVKN